MSKKQPKIPVERIERPVPLVTQVEQALRRAIAERAFPDGKLPTEVELAERFGVSRETVRRSTEVLQNEGLLRKVRRRGTVLAGELRSLQWTAAAQPSRLIAYVQAEYRGAAGEVEGVTAGIEGLMLQGVVQAAESADRDVLVRSATPNRLRQTVEQLAARYRLEGVIAASFAEDKVLRRLGGRPLPIVLLDHDMPLPKVSSLRDDSAAGSRLAVEHLVSLGHRRIAYVHWHRAELNPWRLRGYREALRAAHIAVRRSYELYSEVTAAGARSAGAQLLALEPRPTAVVCFNNTLARHVIDALRPLGVRVGDELSVVGCGGEEVYALTSCQSDWLELGRESLKLLLRQLRGANPSANIEHLQILPKLQLGSTTASPGRSTPCSVTTESDSSRPR